MPLTDTTNVGRVFEQTQTATAPARGLQQALASQVVDDFHEVVFGHAMAFGQLGNRHRALGVQRAIHQHAQGVVGVVRQSHQGALSQVLRSILGWLVFKMHLECIY